MPAPVGIQRLGRGLVQALYVALQALKLYPLENETVQRSLAELQRAVTNALESEGLLEIKTVGDFLFVNEVRLRTDLGNFAAFGAVARALADHGVGSIVVDPSISLEDWAPFLALLLDGKDGSFDELARTLESRSVTSVRVSPARTVVPAGAGGEEDPYRRVRRSYVETVRIIKEILSDLTHGSVGNVRKVKRAVQNIVDRVREEEAAMLAMTTLRVFDDPLSTHSVNVCIFCVIIGWRLGLKKQELYDLGLAGVFHDVGKVGLEPSLLEKSALADDEWGEMESHAALGLRKMFELRGFSSPPFRQMLAVYEHHMRADHGGGYPPVRRTRTPTLFTRIVAVAESFDAALSMRSYRYAALPADRILLDMEKNPRWGVDPLAVKMLIGAIGLYPVGTLVLLNTGELAVVRARNPDQRQIHQPIVSILTSGAGEPLDALPQVDLAAAPLEGAPPRSLARSLDAQQYGVNVGEYFL